MINTHHSTAYDILKTILSGVYNESMRMLNGEAFYTKAQWKRIIWSKAGTLKKKTGLIKNLFLDQQ